VTFDRVLERDFILVLGLTMLEIRGRLLFQSVFSCGYAIRFISLSSHIFIQLRQPIPKILRK